MRGASRDSFAAGQERLEALLTAGTADPAALGQELFAVTAVLDGSAALRRALTDPTASADTKAGLIDRLFGARVGGATADLVAGLVRGRWATATDLPDATEQLGVQATLAAAERGGRLDAVEDELFRFSRSIAGDPALRDAFSVRTVGTDRKAALVHRLLDGKAAPETVQLAVQAATAPRGLRTERVLEQYVEAAAARREQVVAHVVAALPLTEQQRQRLGSALSRSYGREVRLNIDVDPKVVGGLRVQIGGELYDATMLGRLDEARRRLAG